MAKKQKLKQSLQALQRQVQARKRYEASMAAMIKQPNNSKTKQKESKTADSEKVHYVAIHIDPFSGRRSTLPFTSKSTILLIGEGNFSFAHALVKRLASISPEMPSSVVATALDTKESVLEKYPDANDHLSVIEKSGAKVLFGVDGTKLSADKQLRGLHFTRIIFNFPHTGAGTKDRDRNIREHQQLLKLFFEQAQLLLAPLDSLRTRPPTYRTTMYPLAQALSLDNSATNEDRGDDWNDLDSDDEREIAKMPLFGSCELPEIHVSLRTDDPYCDWEMTRVAHHAGLHLRTSFVFDTEGHVYPGYVHQRTSGSAKDGEDMLQNKPCKTFVFIRKSDHTEADSSKSNKSNKKRKRA